MTPTNILSETIAFVQNELQNAEGGHDWFHIERVYRNAITIAKTEVCSLLVVQLAALLHDIADPKFFDGDENIGPQKAKIFLENRNVPETIISQVVYIIEHISFKGGSFATSESPIELQIVQDADRLDAIGAIGIARTFNYGGYKNRRLYDPAIPPNPNQSKEAYQKSTAPTLNHFYEKLLLLKDRMHTQTGKALAEQRHAFMQQFLEQFYAEWQGTT